jgi:hypothetical protein
MLISTPFFFKISEPDVLVFTQHTRLNLFVYLNLPTRQVRGTKPLHASNHEQLIQTSSRTPNNNYCENTSSIPKEFHILFSRKIERTLLHPHPHRYFINSQPRNPSPSPIAIHETKRSRAQVPIPVSDPTLQHFHTANSTWTNNEMERLATPQTQ